MQQGCGIGMAHQWSGKGCGLRQTDEERQTKI
jgi:hypothetical protein